MELPDKIFEIKNDQQFVEMAIRIFRFQAGNNPVYREYINHVGIKPENIVNLKDIPFLPIEFFKTHKIVSFQGEAENIFVSSGTTGSLTSHHYVKDISVYDRSLNNAFQLFYGQPSGYSILALLPSYKERGGSSLVYMVDKLIEKSKNPNSGFYLYDHKNLYKQLIKLEESGQKTLLMGVSFALLDFVEKYSIPMNHTLVMETGGMKGKRKEITRNELHGILKEKLSVETIHSEYGMTELLSQAYSKNNGYFSFPPWARVMIRDVYDPYSYEWVGKSGGINIIDLANYYSCSFIETQDIGKLSEDGSFEVLGRMNQSDIRGCNLMAE